MPKFKPFFLPFLLAFILFSCDNEPIDFSEREAPEPAPEADLIVGNWDLIEAQLADATASFDAGGIPVTAPASGSGSDYDLQLTFTENKDFTATGSYLQNVSVILGSQTYDAPQEVNANDFLSAGSWSRTATLLTIDDGVEAQEVTILDLDENVLEIQFPFTQEQLVQEIPTSITGTLTMRFERGN